MSEELSPDMKVDLRGVVCPLNFVKTKLMLEEMESGQLLEVILDGGEPIKNVPRSVKAEGHEIVRVDRVDEAYRLLIRKA